MKTIRRIDIKRHSLIRAIILYPLDLKRKVKEASKESTKMNKKLIKKEAEYSSLNISEIVLDEIEYKKMVKKQYTDYVSSAQRANPEGHEQAVDIVEEIFKKELS